MKKSYLCLISYSFSLIALSEIINQHPIISVICYFISFILLYPAKISLSKKNIITSIILSISCYLLSLILKLNINFIFILIHIFYNVILLSIIKGLKIGSYHYCLKMILISLAILFSLLLICSLVSYLLTQENSSCLSYSLICAIFSLPFLYCYFTTRNKFFQKTLN